MKAPRLFPLLASLLLAANTQAQNPDRARVEADELIEKAQHAKAEGRGGEAEELMRTAKKLQSEHREGEAPKMERARHEAIVREIEELHRIGKHEEANRLKQRIAESGHGPKKPGLPAVERERLMHLGQAIEHARAAGLREVAEELERIAQRMKEEIAHRERGAPGSPAGPDQMHDAMRELRDGMEELRGRTQKMARAIEELHAQVRALQGGDVKKKGDE